MNGRLKFFIGFLLVIVILLFFSFFYVNRIIKKSFPKVDGEIEVNDLKSEVKIYRDEFGIPYIEAQNEDDLFFALGFVHSQDRLFQMDITRRAGMGRLSEILGSRAIEFDLMFRTVQFNELAKKLYENASPLSKRICGSYVRGINAFIEQSSGNFAIEFDILNYQPEKWEPYQVYLIARLVAWELNLGWWVDAVYGQLQKKIPEEKFRQLIPDYPENSATIIATSKTNNKSTFSVLKEGTPEKKLYSEEIYKTLKDFLELNIKTRKFLGFNESYSGSNSWVVSSKFSNSKKPILANDPHLMYSQPSKWYIVSLNSPELNVSGVTIPGSPSVVIGKNKNIAWGLTNLMLDDSDFFIEQIDSTGNKYLIDNRWKNLSKTIDTIKVKDSSNIILEIKSTHRGPLIQLANKFLSKAQTLQSISMKWTGNELSDEVLTFYKINKAKNYSEFKEALKTFNCPAQNFVCADSKGNIFYKAGGKIPLRKYSNFLFPLDGTKSEYDWTAYLSFENLPELLNPEEGFITTNNNPPSNQFKDLIGNLWEPASRADRINELLKSKKQFSAEDFKKFQNDVNSPYAKNISMHIVNSFERTKILDKDLKAIINLFKNWDGNLKKYSISSTVYNVFLIRLLQNTFSDEMGYEIFKQFLFVGNVPLRIIYQLLNDSPADSISFFDDVSTIKLEKKDDIIRKSLMEAITELKSRFGYDISNWQWGEIHKVRFHHLFSGQNKIIDRMIDVGPYSIGGDQTTLLNTSFKLNEPYENYLGPSMRQIVDLANVDSSWIIITGGQSEHIGHKNYKDQALMWLSGEYINFQTAKEKYKHNRLLILKSKKLE